MGSSEVLTGHLSALTEEKHGNSQDSRYWGLNSKSVLPDYEAVCYLFDSVLVLICSFVRLVDG